MLSQLRSAHVMKIIMGVVAVVFIVGTVILSMDPGGAGQGPDNVVAVINGTEIPYEAYNARVTQLAEMERQRFQRDELSAMDYERIEQQAWDGIVQEVLLSQEAGKLGMEAQDDEIVATLRNNPPEFVRQRFLDDQGQFDMAAYQRALADPMQNWLRDEEYLRAILPSLKLQQVIRAGAVVSEEEVQREYTYRTLRNKVQYAGVEWRSLEIASFDPSPDELRAYFAANQERFSRGESVVLDAIRFAKTPSPIDVNDALTEAQDLLREFSTGQVESFAALAELYSDDPSASRGGSLGWIGPGVLPEAVETAVWSLAPGGRTEPIAAGSGVYVVQVDSVRTDAGGGRSLLVSQLVLQVRTSTETTDSLRTLAFQLGKDAAENFEGAAEKHGLKVERLAPVERSGLVPGFGFSLRLRDWAFAAKPGEVGGPFGSDDAVLVARLVEKHDVTTPTFEEAESRLRNALLEDRKKTMARERLLGVARRVAAGASLADAARAEKLEVKEPAPFTYYESVAGIGNANEFTAVASELLVGRTSGVIETATGAYILQVLDRDRFNPEAYASERNAHFQSLMARRASEVYDTWLQAQRDKATIQDKRGARV